MEGKAKMKKINMTRPVFMFLVVVSSALLITSTAFAAGIIVLDGAFDDWIGQPCISDPIGDSTQVSNDLTSFCFVSDQTDEIVYFEIERVQDTNKPLVTIIYLDINGDGDYTDVEDRYIKTTYNANQNSTRVSVDVYDGQSSLVSNVTSGADWGQQGSNGASKVELGVSFADLGIIPGSTVAVSMYSVSMQGAVIDDGMAEIQWTPANALGWALITVILIVSAALMTQKVRDNNKQEITA